MFYTKTIIGNTTITTDINCENVFTRCTGCGREISVDLAEQFAAGDFCLDSTKIYCAECTRRMDELRRRVLLARHPLPHTEGGTTHAEKED